nr:MAG TPA: hypothetical protein [Caudoviricetes sp.]DAV83982.1 MAG TPA: hypothetical protein [Caudoviricetes sp.]
MVSRLLHFLQQLPGKLPAGRVCCGLELPDGPGLADHEKSSPGLPLGRHILIAGQRGADVVTKQLHLVHL